MFKLVSKCLLIIAFAISTLSCKHFEKNTAIIVTEKDNSNFRFFSKIVADSFSISIKLPNNYDPKVRYPIVYLLDANLYFDIIGTTLNKFSEVGLAPEVILVGIGYKDYETMDSLRSRDYTYPVANAEYEMSMSGGADKFLKFIDSELIPHVETEYRTDTSKRILMGHSLGAYFVTYTLLQQVLGRENHFDGFIAASPSLHYNCYYLLSEFRKAAQLALGGERAKAYFTFGGLEDKEDDDEPNAKKLGALEKELIEVIAKKQARNIDFKCDIFSNLAHMDTSIPSFIKGLQWQLMTGK